MERTYILGNSPTLEKFEGYTVQVPQFSKESEMHDWVIELFKESVKHVIIEISENPIRSLQIGYHIRLSIEELGEQSLIPIFFISHLSLNEVLIKSEIYSQILSTKGVFFSLFDLESNKEEAKYIHGLAEREYLVKFLKVIQIQPDEKIGRHSLANKWGVYALAKAVNAESTIRNTDYKKLLYFKYVSAFNNINKLKPTSLKVLEQNVESVNTIEARGKRILLIDDEADNGWYDILKKIIKTSTPDDFKVINERIKTYENFSDLNKTTIEKEEFDLYLVDLRLSGLDEDENLDSQMFSGMSVLKKLKNLNDGNQVIIFSASNKIWNLQSLIAAEADGYYLKESPSYMFSPNLSKQKFYDFKNNVEICFAKNYLKEVFSIVAEIKNEIRTSLNRYFVDPIHPSWLTQDKSLDAVKGLSNNIIEQIELFQTIIKLNRRNEHDLFKQPLIILHQIFENFVQSPLNYKKEEKRKTKVPKLYLKSKEVETVTEHKTLIGEKCIQFKFKFDYYLFQNKESSPSRISLKFYETKSSIDEYNSNYYFELYLLFKRHNLSENELDNYLLLRNLRNQYCGHNKNTYNHLERPLNSQDILDYMNILKRVLLPN